MDSSSIVCLADRIIARGDGEIPRLETLSYFDDSEPNWNERPYVAVVECKRGRAGCHIDVPPDGLHLAAEGGNTAPAPGASQLTNAAAEQFRAHLHMNGIRVLLSGIGGDEVLGGVPDPVPELADLLRAGKLRALFVQMTAWALALRRPLFGLLAETLGAFLPADLSRGTVRSNRPSWIRPKFLDKNLTTLQRFTLRGSRPSFQDNLRTLEVLRAQLGCSPVSCRPPYKKRYPYLDRDLLEFLFAIPPEQLLRPGRRRHLMRRSLSGIVPEEILNRRRKAYVVRGPTLDLLHRARALTERIDAIPEALLQIIDPDALRRVLAGVSQSSDIPLVPLIRTFALDAWLHDLENSGIWNGRIVANGTAHDVRAAANADRFSSAEDQTTAERR
jgi:asparagine synthase (glutamine-hydrolysing)